MLTVALPKGRLGEKVFAMFSSLGYGCDDLTPESRKLVFEGENARFILVKPTDVPVYIAQGAADVGVVGKDVLQESGENIYELLDLNFGKCAMCVAAREGWQEDMSRPLRVATKYPNCAKAHYAAKNRDITVIKLNGSIELAPILGMADVIVDIVETGTTLKENHLEVIETAFPISARLVANKRAYRFMQEEIENLRMALAEKLQEK